MGMAAVMIWAFWCGGRLPRWVWGVIIFDMVFATPKMVHDYYSLFSTGHF